MARNNVIELRPDFNIYDLFLNMNNTQTELNEKATKCILQLQKKYKTLKSFIIALTITTIMGFMAFGLAINKVKTEPTTVYIQGESATVDLNDLPLAPLEELK